jgi:hypothetical protein
MAGLSETLGSSWAPFAIHPCPRKPSYFNSLTTLLKKVSDVQKKLEKTRKNGYNLSLLAQIVWKYWPIEIKNKNWNPIST